MTVQKKRTLAEAAQDVLRGSAVAAQPSALSRPGEVVELGGSSQKQPDGGDKSTGAAASDNASKFTPPQTTKVGTSPAVGAQASDLPAGANTAPNSVTAKVQPPLATVSGDATKVVPHMQQTEEVAPEGEQVEVVVDAPVVEAPAKTEAEIAEEVEARRALIKEKFAALSIEEDMKAMFAGTEFSEEFQTKARTIFEAAVTARALAVIEEVEKGIMGAAEEAVEEIKEELEERSNKYLSYVTEEWVKSNEVAIVSGLRTEITEEFVAGLKSLFEDNNLEIPEEQVKVVEEQTAEIAGLQAQINETLNKNIELTNKINEFTRARTLNTVCEGLTATQTEKMKTLAEGVDFTTEGEYKGKLAVIREQYFSSGKKEDVVTGTVVSDEAVVLTEEKVVHPDVAAVVRALNRTKR